MSAAGGDVPPDASPTGAVLRGDEYWRNDGLPLRPPKTYLGPGASFCCALALRIAIVVCSAVAFVLCIVTQVTPFFEWFSFFGTHKVKYLWYSAWVNEEGSVTSTTDDRDGPLLDSAICLVIALILSAFALALSIAYLALLCAHRSQRKRDNADAECRHQSRLQKLEEADAETRALGASEAYRSTSRRRETLLEGLRRDAHGDGVGLYERELTRRRADRGVWFGVFFALLVTFVLLLVGFIVAVVVFNGPSEIGSDREASMGAGVWIALVAAIVALMAFILAALRPFGRGPAVVLVSPGPYNAALYARADAALIDRPDDDSATDAPLAQNALDGNREEDMDNDGPPLERPIMYIGPGVTRCALALRIVILILSFVAVVLGSATQGIAIYYLADGRYHYLWYIENEGTYNDLTGAAALHMSGLIFIIFALALSIAYLVLLYVYRSQRDRDNAEAECRHQARLQRLQDADTEMRDLGAGDAHQSTTQRRGALLESLRRDAHDDGVGLYERERKRRLGDRGVWFGIFFALVMGFALALGGFAAIVVRFNDSYKSDANSADYNVPRNSLGVGVWTGLAAGLVALAAFVVTALRPCGRGPQNELVHQYPYDGLGPKPTGEFHPYADLDTAPGAVQARQGTAEPITTGLMVYRVGGVPAERTYITATPVPVSENYPLYHRSYGRGYYYGNEAGQTANTRVVGADSARR